MATANSKELYIPLAPIVGKKNTDGSYTLSALDIKNLNDNLYAIARKIQGGLNLSDLTSETKQTFDGMVTFIDLATGGSTTINGSNITTGTISANRVSGGVLQGAVVQTKDSSDALSITLEGGQIKIRKKFGMDWLVLATISADAFDNRVYISGLTYPLVVESDGILKFDAGSNMSIDSGGTIYIGASTGKSGNVNIGQAGGTINLVGDVYVNGTPL